MIEKILTAITTATGLTPTPFDTDLASLPAIIYTYYRTSLWQYQLTIRVIGKTLSSCDTIANQIVEAIADFGDDNKIPTISSIELNGGGVLKDYETNTIHKQMYFDVRSK